MAFEEMAAQIVRTIQEQGFPGVDGMTATSEMDRFARDVEPVEARVEISPDWRAALDRYVERLVAMWRRTSEALARTCEDLLATRRRAAVVTLLAGLALGLMLGGLLW